MSVKIRLRRMGAKKKPFYRLVVADARSPRDGRFIEAVGIYDPLASPALVRLDADRIKDWISKGARPTDVARQLLVAEGVIERSGPVYDPADAKPKVSRKAQAKAAAAAEAPPAAEEPAPAEAPAAEEPAPAEAPAAEEPAAAEAPAEETAPTEASAPTPEPAAEEPAAEEKTVSAGAEPGSPSSEAEPEPAPAADAHAEAPAEGAPETAK